MFRHGSVPQEDSSARRTPGSAVLLLRGRRSGAERVLSEPRGASGRRHERTGVKQLRDISRSPDISEAPFRHET